MSRSFNILSAVAAILLALDNQRVKCSHEITHIPDPVCVKRRDAGDFVYTGSGCTMPFKMVCPATYLIADDTCISNQDLVMECDLRLGSTDLTAEPPIGVAIENALLSMYPPPSVSPVAAQVAYYNQTLTHPLDNCSIVSMEVYRGEEVAIAIDYSGFTIGDNGTIQVDEGSLAYDRSDYEGELYRMNVSCSDSDVMINEGCLFFKLLGTTSIGKAKFNCTIQGGENDKECVREDLSKMESTTTSESEPTTEPDRNLLEYVVIGAGGGIGGLVLVILFLCVVIGCLATHRRRKNNYVINTTSHSAHQTRHTNQHQQLSATIQGPVTGVHSVEPVAVSVIQMDQLGRPAASAVADTDLEEDEEHAYATIVEPQKAAEVMQGLQASNHPCVREVTATAEISGGRDTRSEPQVEDSGNTTTVAAAVDCRQRQEDNIDDVTFETFKPKPAVKEERPGRKPEIVAPPPYEPVTVIPPATHTPAVPTEEYDKLVHEGAMQKARHHTLPTSSVQYSQLNRQESRGSPPQVPLLGHTSEADLRKTEEWAEQDKTPSNVRSGYSVLVPAFSSRDSQPSPPPLPPPLHPSDPIITTKKSKNRKQQPRYKFIYDSSSDEDDSINHHQLPLYNQPTTLSLRNPAFGDDTPVMAGEDTNMEAIYDVPPPSSPLLSSQDSYVDMQGHHIHRV